MKIKIVFLLILFNGSFAFSQVSQDSDKKELGFSSNPPIMINGASSNYYFDYVKDQVELKKQNSEKYSEDNLSWYFEFYIDALLRNDVYVLDGQRFSRKQLEERYGDKVDKAIEQFNFEKEIKPFKIIEEINKYSAYFTIEEHINKSNYYKMRASYLDENYYAANMIGENLIKAFNSNEITHSFRKFTEGIEMAKVYNYVISTLFIMNKNERALELSEVVLNNKNLQFDRFLEFYAHSLYRSDRKTDACIILNKAYLNGNERAKNFIKEYCQ